MPANLRHCAKHSRRRSPLRLAAFYAELPRKFAEIAALVMREELAKKR